MPPVSVSHRPQTLKQAKKAYRKSGATKQLTASELAAIERRAVLQERADRIKDRELRRKANIKRKEERNERDREARQRMGVVVPAKEGIHVGPSQLSLGGFLTAGKKRKMEEEGKGNVKSIEGDMVDFTMKGCQTSSIPRIPWRNPFLVISPNMKTPTDWPTGASSIEPPTVIDLKISSTVQSCCPNKVETLPPKLHSPQKAPTNSAGSKILDKDDGEQQGSRSTIMGPPPPRILNGFENKKTDSQQKLTDVRSEERPLDALEDCWDDFFASGTQIARELSPPPLKSIPMAPPPSRQAHSLQHQSTLPITPKDDAAALLAQLSTQDLDISGDLTQTIPPILAPDSTTDLLAQICTQDLDFSLDLTQTAPVPPPPPPTRPFPAETSDFDEDLTEEDLEDVVLEFERESTTAKSDSRSLSPEKIKEEDFQKVYCKGLVRDVCIRAGYESEDEAFDLSTQDLCELAWNENDYYGDDYGDI